jgi:hypothetical protein
MKQEEDYAQLTKENSMTTTKIYRFCAICSCPRDLHRKYGPCFCEGTCQACSITEGAAIPCNCDYYESERSLLSADPYCDSCLTVAYDHVGHGQAEQVEFLQAIGADLEDHECDAVTEPDLGPCSCLAHGRSEVMLVN